MRRAVTILLVSSLAVPVRPARSIAGSSASPQPGRAVATPPGRVPSSPTSTRQELHIPWREAGWTAEEAAAHLLSRFSFGARPGEVEAVSKMGLERWFEAQLAAEGLDAALAARLASRPLLAMSARELFQAFPPRRQPGDGEEGEGGPERRTAQDAPQRALLAAMMDQKILRAVESENQLVEVMVDFWFNHFNVSFTDRQVRPFLVSYERDALRPHALGSFLGLLEATARHPAMLVFLDNARSSAAPGAQTTFDDRREELRRKHPGMRGRPDGERPPPQRERGPNENYARELLELHTLGVDGGYTQQDVTEVARAFTGWTVMPIGDRRERAESRLDRVLRAGGMGFEREGDFLFRADEHDALEKEVLGVRLPAGRGVEDGEQVLRFLATRRSTARHLAEKLAVRFVADHPTAPLVERLTGLYLGSGGDIRQLLRGIAASPELWSPDSRGAKIKSPFELVVSALRATGSRVRDTAGVARWIARMGEPLYLNQVPTGYPDRGTAWVNSGTLVTRMSFALELAAGKVAGVELGALREGLSTQLGAPDFQRR